MRSNNFCLTARSSLLASAAASPRTTATGSKNPETAMCAWTPRPARCRTAAERPALVCKLAADERTAYQDEIDRLQRSGGARPARRETREFAGKAELSLPTEEEFNKTLSYMERFMRSFMDLTKDLDKDKQIEKPPATPQKT